MIRTLVCWTGIAFSLIGGIALELHGDRLGGIHMDVLACFLLLMVIESKVRS